MSIFVSIIIPSYKPGIYLKECLKSISNQTIASYRYEVLVILNGCNEPYFSYIESLTKEIFGEDENIKIVQTDTPGVSRARNIGIDEAQGDFITFVDDDDIVSSTYLEELLRVSSPECIGCSNSYAFVNDISEKKANFVTPAFEECNGTPFSLIQYRKFLSAPWAKLIHKSIIHGSRFPIDMKKSEDSVFCLQISPKIKDMKLASSDAVYYQRLREGSAMRKKESYWSIIKEHLFIEYKYLSVWIKNPFRYNLKFLLSRIAACAKNCMIYIKSQNK